MERIPQISQSDQKSDVPFEITNKEVDLPNGEQREGDINAAVEEVMRPENGSMSPEAVLNNKKNTESAKKRGV